MIRRRAASPPESTVWPDALPRPNEDYYFSITACGNSKLVWGFHDAHDEENGTIWSNPLLDKKQLYDSSRTISDRVIDFCSYVTTEVRHGVRNPCDYIFGENCAISLESASWETVSRGCKITVYVVGTNTLQLELISKLFAVIPSRVYLMKSADFLIASDTSDKNIEVDRLAALRGAAHCEGFPSILFDAGDFLTYTAADEEGRILGGGVSPGLSLRVSSMNGRRDVDTITSEHLDGILEEVANNEKPLHIFSSNATESVIAAALSEVSCHIANVVRIWLEKVGQTSVHTKLRATRNSLDATKQNRNRVVSIIGKHGSVVERLLQQNSGGLIESPRRGSAPNINTSLSHHFIPDGIQSAISDQTRIARTRIASTNDAISLSSANSGEIEILGTAEAIDQFSIVSPNILSKVEKVSQMEYINKRVAKEVNENEFKEGVIQSVVKNTFGIALYSIKFDDGSIDQASLKMVIKMHTQFKQSTGGIVTPGQITTVNELFLASAKRKRGRPRKTHIKIEAAAGDLSNGKEDDNLVTSKKSRTITLSDEEATGAKIAQDVSGRNSIRKVSNKRKASSKDQLYEKDDNSIINITYVSDEKASSYKGKKITKYFGSKFFTGEVTGYSRQQKGRVWWSVTYEDGDKEELNDRQLDDGLNLFKSVRPN